MRERAGAGNFRSLSAYVRALIAADLAVEK